LEESELSLNSYSDWYCSTHKNFKNVATEIDKVDKAIMGKKLKALEVGMHSLAFLNSPPSLTVAFACIDTGNLRVPMNNVIMTLASSFHSKYCHKLLKAKAGFHLSVVCGHLNDLHTAVHNILTKESLTLKY
jgi:hypothetical protein